MSRVRSIQMLGVKSRCRSLRDKAQNKWELWLYQKCSIPTVGILEHQMKTQCRTVLRNEAPGKVLWGWVMKPVLINISYICSVLFCSLAAPCNIGAAVWTPRSADGLHLGTRADGGKQIVLAYSNEVNMLGSQCSGWEEGNNHSYSNSKIRPVWDSAYSDEGGRLSRVTVRQSSHSLHCMECVGMS